MANSATPRTCGQAVVLLQGLRARDGVTAAADELRRSYYIVAPVEGRIVAESHTPGAVMGMV